MTVVGLYTGWGDIPTCCHGSPYGGNGHRGHPRVCKKWLISTITTRYDQVRTCVDQGIRE